MWKQSGNKHVRSDGAKVYELGNGKWTGQDGGGEEYKYSSAGGNSRGYFWKDAERAMINVDKHFPLLSIVADKARKTKSQRTRTAKRSKARLSSRTDATKEPIVEMEKFACVQTKTGYEINIGNTIVVIEDPKSIMIMQNE